MTGKWKFILNALFQCTWGILQTFIGFLLLLWCVVVCKKKPFLYNGDTIVCEFPNKSGSLSLGLFFFLHPKAVNDEYTKRHEWGHTRQSLLLGPLYLFVIALPSMVWCNGFRKYREENKISYFVFFTEKWANKCAKLPDIEESKEEEKQNEVSD